MTIDNFKQIKDLLAFDSEDDFYFLQILKRKKENPEVPSNHNNNKRSIRTYYINSLEYYEGIQEEIKALCKATNSRAYIHPTRRSYKRVGKLCAIEVMERCFNEQYKHIYKAFNTACGHKESGSSTEYYIDKYQYPIKKLWVLDVDNPELLEQYCSILDPKCIVDIITTKSGFHIITTPFRSDTFLQDCSIRGLENIDIQRNNPTLLYYEGKDK